MSSFISNLIVSGGVLAVFLTMAAESAGIPISSEIVVPLGGALASQGKLSFVAVVAASSVGNLVGSLTAFHLTRRYGRAVLLGPGRRVGLSEGHVALAERFFDRFGDWAVFIGRLLPVVRTYISFPAALGRMSTARFSALTILGAVPWNVALAYAGYKLGEHWQEVEHVLGRATIPIVVAVAIVLVVGYVMGSRWIDRRRDEPDAAGGEVTSPGRESA